MNRTLIEKFFDSIISTAYAPGLSYVKVVADEAFYPIEIKNALDWTKYNVVLPIEQMTEEDWSNLWSATAERYDKYVNQGGVYNTINFWGSGIPEAVVTLLKINGHNGQIAWNDPSLYNYANYLTMGLVDQFNKTANTPMSDPEYWRAMRTLLTTEATAIGIYNAIASGTALPTTTEELIKWGDKYSKTPSGTVSSGTFDNGFEKDTNETIHYSFPNEIGHVLSQRGELTGTVRDKLLTTTVNSELREIVNQLYREGAVVGDGGTAAMLIEEFNSGTSTHLLKATERLTQLNRLITSGTLGMNDLDIAIAIRDDLQYAVDLFK